MSSSGRFKRSLISLYVSVSPVSFKGPQCIALIFKSSEAVTSQQCECISYPDTDMVS